MSFHDLLFYIFPPQTTHLLTIRQQSIELPLGLNAAIFEDDDMIGLAQGGAAVRDGEAGGARREAGPEQLFGLDIEGAGEVIDDQQFRVTHEHPRSGGSLYLPTGELNAARADLRLQALLQLGNIAL